MSDLAEPSLPLRAAGKPLAAVRWADALRRRPALVAVLLIAAIDLVFVLRTGLSFTGWKKPLFDGALFLAMSAFYRFVRPNRTLSELPLYVALWIAFTTAGAIGTYLAGAAAQPLQDAALSVFDAAIGFDWIAWVGFVRSQPGLNEALRLAYDSLMVQIVGSVMLFALARVPGRNEEFLLASALAMLVVIAVSAALPALGPWVLHGYGALAAHDTAYVPHVLALRAGAPPTFDLGLMQGIVCLPSYHTVLAILLPWAHRGLRWTFPPVVLLNGAMLLSIPSEGGHYLADMIAGALVAGLAIAGARLLRPVPGSAALAESLPTRR